MDTEVLIKTCLDDHYQEILNYMYLQSGSKEDAYDLTQEVYIKVVKHAESFQGNSQPRTWLFSIARNVFLTHLRKKYRFKKLLDKMKGSSTSQVESEHGIPENSEIFMVLDQCSQEDRQLIMLKHYFGFSYQEISKILNLSESNVGVRLSRALQGIRTSWKGSEIDEA